MAEDEGWSGGTRREKWRKDKYVKGWGVFDERAMEMTKYE
jgi:hypothetical protein